MKVFRVMLVLAALAVLLHGCGESGETTGDEPAKTVARDAQPQKEPPADSEKRHLDVDLNGYNGPETVGILIAKKRDYFGDVGVGVTPFSPVTPDRPVPYVIEGPVDLAVAQEPQVMMAKSKGAPLEILGSVIAQPTAAMIWPKDSKILEIADLEGKTIAYPGVPFQKAFLESVLADAGLTLDDVKLENVGYDLVPSLVKGKADAIFGGSANMEGARLRSRGMELVVSPVEKLGIPAYSELVVFARSDRIAEEPKVFAAFMAALEKGTAAAVEDPEAAVDVIEGRSERDINIEREAREAQVEATLPLLSRSGDVEPAQAERLGKWMHSEGMIETVVPTEALFASTAER
jgi:putative hydroxymethylpyrimidine transport system substrate-binding protein